MCCSLCLTYFNRLHASTQDPEFSLCTCCCSWFLLDVSIMCSVPLSGPPACLHVLCFHYFWHDPTFWAGTATFQCSDTVVFVFVFAIPVCLDPCDPVDCGNSVPPCHSEPVWRNDLVSRTKKDQRNLPFCLWLSLFHMFRLKCVPTVGVLFVQAF